MNHFLQKVFIYDEFNVLAYPIVGQGLLQLVKYKTTYTTPAKSKGWPARAMVIQ